MPTSAYNMTLHIFNPEHDIALASGLSNFTAPHAGRQLRHDLGFLPALWAEADDTILVDDAETAARMVRRRDVATKQFVEKHQLASLPVGHIEPWGWNSALRAYLLRMGVSESLMPTEAALETIRQLSHRSTAAQLLPKLRLDGTVGEAVECHTGEEVAERVALYGKAVLKAPWSSSGRGLRFASGKEDMERLSGWVSNLLARQGSVMVEPYYHKVKDFGMEFQSDGEGTVSYEGLSLFHTENGAYTGNILAAEDAKREALSRYIPMQLLDEIQHTICHELSILFKGRYQGPFGVDMMVVGNAQYTMNNAQCTIHPCVEINLRRTMGHAALAVERRLNPTDNPDLRHVMRIGYSEGNYKLTIKRLYR